jgi:hypothetical protein
MFRSQASNFSSSFFLGGGAPATDKDLTVDGGDHVEGCLGPLLTAMMHLLEQQYQPSSSNANVNLPNLGFFSSNSGGWSGSSQQDAPPLLQQQEWHVMLAATGPVTAIAREEPKVKEVDVGVATAWQVLLLDEMHQDMQGRLATE